MRNLSRILEIKSPLYLILIAAIFFALALEPFGFTTAGFICFIALNYFIKHLTIKKSWKLATIGTILFSFCVTLTAFHWIWNAIRNISGQGIFISSLLFLLYAAGSFYKIGIIFFGSVLLTKIRNIKESHLVVLIVPSLFLLSDWLCPMIFPVKWGDLFRNQLFWRQSAKFGSEFLGFISVISAGFLYLLIQERNKGIKNYIKYLSPILAILCLNILFLAETLPNNRILNLSLLQPNTTYAKRELLEDQNRMTETMQSVYNLGLEAIQKSNEPLDLVIFPESAIPFLGTLANTSKESTYSKSFVEITENLVQLGNVPILFNELVFDEGSRNSITLLHPISLKSERRYKQLLLPFGEYLPGESFFPGIRSLFPESSNHVPGIPSNVLEFRSRDGSYVSMNGFICYELLYPELLREMELRSPSEFLVNLTNDSWFESQTETEQHAGAGRLRSVELGRPLVRVAVTGLTLAFDPWGRDMMIPPATNQKSISYLKLPTVSKLKTTPYLTYGPYPWRIFVILILIVIILRSEKSIVRS